MQYLLTQEEMTAIRATNAQLDKLPKIEVLTEVCKHVATTMIATVSIASLEGEKPSPRPHGCVHVKDPDPRWQTRYCDRCPVRKICPMPKDFSK